MSEKWNLAGTYMEACNCEAACPCIFTSPPTEEDCTALLGWHVDKGSFGDVALDGLNVALALYSPGHMLQGNWQVALYLDDKATSSQADALGKIFSGQAGGPIAAMSGLIGEVLGLKSVAIEHQSEGGKGSLRVGDVGEIEIAAIQGLDGAEVTIRDQPVNLVPGHPLVVAQSKQLGYRDHGFQWEISGRNGFLANFTYQGEG